VNHRVYRAGPGQWVAYCERCAWTVTEPDQDRAYRATNLHICCPVGGFS
jgi:hypothetical protein